MSFIKEEDRYTENEVCVICRRCGKFARRDCAGKSAVLYAAISGNGCPHFVEYIDPNAVNSKRVGKNEIQ